MFKWFRARREQTILDILVSKQIPLQQKKRAADQYLIKYHMLSINLPLLIFKLFQKVESRKMSA